LGWTSRPGGVLLKLHNTQTTTKISLFELALGKEARKPMDLAIPMGRKDHSKEVVEMVKGHEKLYTLPKKFLELAQK
jgi:hypothetical protein